MKWGCDSEKNGNEEDIFVEVTLTDVKFQEVNAILVMKGKVNYPCPGDKWSWGAKLQNDYNTQWTL